MKISAVTALAVSLAPVYSYLQASPFELNSLNSHILLRRGSPGGSPRAGAGGSGGSPQARPPQSAGGARSSTGGGSAGGGSPAGPSGSSSQLPAGNLFARPGGRQPRGRRGPPRAPPSDGESDSSVDDPRPRPGGIRAKTKVTATGPAKVNWDVYGFHGGRTELGQGEKFKYSHRDNQVSDMEVTTLPGNPPGKAKVTVKSQKKVNASVWNHGDGTGSITPMIPERLDPKNVAPGTSENQVQRTRPHERYPIKFSSKIDGPGRIYAEGIN